MSNENVRESLSFAYKPQHLIEVHVHKCKITFIDSLFHLTAPVLIKISWKSTVTGSNSGQTLLSPLEKKVTKIHLELLW